MSTKWTFVARLCYPSQSLQIVQESSPTPPPPEVVLNAPVLSNLKNISSLRIKVAKLDGWERELDNIVIKDADRQSIKSNH